MMALTAVQYLILGIVQGITEWLPISSSGVLALILSNFFNVVQPDELISELLFLHLGTLLAVLIYMRKEVVKIIKTLFNYKNSRNEDKKIFNFLLISTLITGIIGLIILKIITDATTSLEFTGKTITVVIGFLLLITGVFQLKVKRKGLKTEENLKTNDSVILGFVQGLSSLPGISRSGITVSSLLLKKFNDTTALKLSFLMSIPIVLLGNLLLNLDKLTFSNVAWLGIAAAFLFGLLTIHGLIKLSRKINFGWFVLIFALLMMVSVFV